MTKRYGRQQRRKARALASSLHQEIEALEKHNAYLEQATYQARKIIQLVDDVCPNSVALKNAQIVGPHIKHMSMRQQLQTRGPEDSPCFIDFDLTTVNLFDLEVDMYKPEFQQCIHFEVAFDDRRAGYRLSKKAFDTTPSAFLAERIANELLHHMRKI